MHRINRLHSVARSSRRALGKTLHPQLLAFPRCLHTEYEDKYSEKLRKIAEQRGLSVSELKAKIKLEQEELKRQQRDPTPTRSQTEQEDSVEAGRKDSSPVKPLSSILNIPRILAGTHTAEQIEALWTVYHASRSNGTGRGYVCACIPLDLYTKMASTAAKYPMFVVPIRRDKDPASPPAEGEADAAHEFYFLQWAFHDAPPDSLAERRRFIRPASRCEASSVVGCQPTNIHGHVHASAGIQNAGVLRDAIPGGEITPSAAADSAGVDGRYLLQQEDAHRLSMSVRHFYLSDGEESLDRGSLVKAFHETPNEFEWEKLLNHAV
ncbi:hypothetical protein MVEN_01923100 [Mycena venus]|uniref:Uncharacterized protein n=1 Tax=Mycena venus TaxID=2733690 RepID=A0A8H6XGG9_9AGAR|nr:hypothetical protein MVEN_01923100 [Mycena venus]